MKYDSILIDIGDLQRVSKGYRTHGGISQRVRERITSRNNYLVRNGLSKLDLRKRRDILIGEVAEEAVANIFIRSGASVYPLSWQEFKYSPSESSVDLVAWNGNEKLNIQVKGSEAGHRAISVHHANQYLSSNVDVIIFVAIRELDGDSNKKLVNASSFFCEITSIVKPKEIIDTWELRTETLIHPDNSAFIKEWEENNEIS